MNKLILFTYFICFSYFLQGQGYEENFRKGREAFASGNFTSYLQYMSSANKQRPGHQTIMYHLAVAFALQQQEDSACYYLANVINIDTKHYDLNRPEFKSLRKNACFKRILDRREFLEFPMRTSDTLMVIQDSLLHIEGIAFHKRQNQFYVSSINKRNIFKLNAGDKPTPILKESLSISPTGLAFDSQGFLWVVAMGIKEGGLADDSPHLFHSELYKIDIQTGEILSSYKLADNQEHLFGDLMVTDKDEVFISDSKANTVYKLQNNTLQEVVHSDEWISIQGITLMKNHLIIADYVLGIYVYDLSQGFLRKLFNPKQLSLKGIDGLYHYEDALFAIQNGVHPNRIIKMKLSPTLNSLLYSEFVEKNHPAFGEPTLGVLHRGQLAFVANSFWNKNEGGLVVNEEGELPLILNITLEPENKESRVSVLEKIQVLDQQLDEALYYYNNNWKAFRSYAKNRGFIVDYSLQLDDENNMLLLETVFANEAMRNQIETHFSEWSKQKNGPLLLNELTPGSFRSSMSTEIYKRLDDGTQYTTLINSACNDKPSRAFDFWIGDWEVYNEAGDYLGHNTISLIENGCGLMENWSSAQASYTGSSYNFYDAKSNVWRQVWIDNQGGVLRLKGGIVDGSMQMSTTADQSELDQPSINRITWTPLDNGHVIQVWDISNNGGESWERVFYGRYISK